MFLQKGHRKKYGDPFVYLPLTYIFLQCACNFRNAERLCDIAVHEQLP